MKKYAGQAIAIIMVVLVVAAVIGASLYSRMIRNKGEVIDTRESSKALEQSGNILDSFIAVDIRNLQEGLYATLDEDPDNKITIEADDISELKYKIQDEFITIEGLDLDKLDQMDASCSKYKMSFEFAPLTEGPEYKVGDVMAVNLSSVTPLPEDCTSVKLTFSPEGEDRLFTVKKIYKEGSGYRAYELNDMLLYCLKGDNTCGQVLPTSSIEVWESKPILEVSLDESLSEIRVIPLTGKIKIGIGSDTCGNVFNQFLIKATSICSGQERTMQVIIPSATNYGYDPMFDYTIYNSNGALVPVVL
jgi:hypothetical protein